MCAVPDTSVIHIQIEEYWKIMNFDNHNVSSKEVFNKQWGVNSLKAVEAEIMLDILEFLNKSTTSQLEG